MFILSNGQYPIIFCFSFKIWSEKCSITIFKNIAFFFYFYRYYRNIFHCFCILIKFDKIHLIFSCFHFVYFFVCFWFICNNFFFHFHNELHFDWYACDVNRVNQVKNNEQHSLTIFGRNIHLYSVYIRVIHR